LARGSWKLGVLLCLVTATLRAQEANGRWKTFVSEKGFRVSYPDKWAVIGISKSQLDILGPPGAKRLNGVVIGDGASEILVFQTARSAKQDGVGSVKGLDVISTKTFMLAGRQVTQNMYGDEMGPDSYVIQTNSCIAVSQHEDICVEERHWKGDPKSGEFNRTALTILSTASALGNK